MTPHCARNFAVPRARQCSSFLKPMLAALSILLCLSYFLQNNGLRGLKMRKTTKYSIINMITLLRTMSQFSANIVRH